MSDLKLMYVDSMVQQIKAAMADGRLFSLHFMQGFEVINSNHVEAVALNGAELFIGLRSGREHILRYDQLVRVDFRAHSN